MYIKVGVLFGRRRERKRGKRVRESEGERKRERERERERERKEERERKKESEREFHLVYFINLNQDLGLGYKHSCTERGGWRGRQKGGPKRFQKTFSDKTYHLVQQEYQF